MTFEEWLERVALYVGDTLYGTNGVDAMFEDRDELEELFDEGLDPDTAAERWFDSWDTDDDEDSDDDLNGDDD